MNSTQEMIKRLFLSIAISVAVLIAGTSSAAADVTICHGDLPSGTYDTVIVPKGAFCEVVFVEVTVQNNVIVQEDALLFVDGSTFTVNGNLQGDGLRIGDRRENSVVMIHGNVTITGFVTITGSGSLGFVLRGVNIGGHLHITGAKEGGRVENSQITGNVILQNILRGIEFVGNQVGGNVSCHRNTPSPRFISQVTGQIIGDC
jgi:hypothetical protein